MKCIIIDREIEGKHDERHFLDVENGRSRLQETIARNLPFCNEYIIITQENNDNKIKSQMQVFQGVEYRCSYLDKSIGTIEAIKLACRTIDENELIFVTYADLLIDARIESSEQGLSYKDSIIQGREHAEGDCFVFFGDENEYKKTSMIMFKNRIFLNEKGLSGQSCLNSFEKNILGSIENVKVIITGFRWSSDESILDFYDERVKEIKEKMIKLSPAFKDYIWGGTKLKDVYGKNCDFDIVAESWELSAHKDGQSIVEDGKYKGVSFGEYLRMAGSQVLGWKAKPLQEFPLLIKYIDAKGVLSVQVHPNDDYALKNEGEYGKNEMWYVVDAEAGSGLYVGFNKDTTIEEVERRIKDNSIMEILNFCPTHSGDVFFIPAGTVHAIGEGNLICEIQQNSNSTYRMYDYDRRDKNGNPRPLHIEKSLDVLNYNKYIQTDYKNNTSSGVRTLSKCKYFEANLYEIDGEKQISIHNDSFKSLICIAGSGTASIDNIEKDIKAGDSIFIPAQEETLNLKGTMTTIISQI